MWFGAKGNMKEYFVCTYERTDVKTGEKIKIEEMRRYRGKVTVGSPELKLTLTLPPPPPPTPPPSITLPPEASFHKDDVGKTIVIWNDSYRFITRIDAVHDDLESVTLAEPAKENITGAYIAWGTDDQW